MTAKAMLKFDEVCARTTLSVTEIKRRIAAGTFPKPVQLGQRRIAWSEEAVSAWIEAQIAGGEAKA